jgi:uncharacterized membrane protein
LRQEVFAVAQGFLSGVFLMRGSLGRPWFGAHPRGIGTSGPIVWQGWATVGVFAIVLFLECWRLRDDSQTFAVWATLVVMALVCMLKTEGGWRRRRGRPID